RVVKRAQRHFSARPLRYDFESERSAVAFTWRREFFALIAAPAMAPTPASTPRVACGCLRMKASAASMRGFRPPGCAGRKGPCGVGSLAAGGARYAATGVGAFIGALAFA